MNDQDLSVEALTAVVQKAMGSTSVASDPNHRSVEPCLTLDSKGESMELSLPEADEHLSPSFVMPVKKKPMTSLVGKRTKPAKKKSRS